MIEQWTYEYLPFTLTQTSDEIPNFRIVPCDGGEYIAEINEHLPAEVREQHARLIAAAPELLEALKSLMDTWECNPDHYAEEIETYSPLIAKAEGR